jgi:uncharacterized protein with FMN-binding domain
MKRVLLSITGTVLGLVALLSFKSNGHSVTTGAGLPSASLPSAPSSSGASSSSSAPSSGSTGSGRSASRSTTAAPPTTVSRTLTGDAVQTQYGVVQVQLTASGKKIQNVSFLQLTANDGRSQQINSYAGPILLQETLSAQSAQIDTVSGATYTSEGYLQSLQTALDKAGP